MAERFTDIFNAGATPPQHVLLAIAAYAAQGGAINSAVAVSIEAERTRAEKKESERFIHALTDMATREQIDALRDRLDELERAAIEALHENEERLRRAREELERIDREAPTITLPDGTTAKVYRDYDRVRFADGSFVDRAIVEAERVSEDPGNWNTHESLLGRAQRFEADQGVLSRRLDWIGTTREKLKSGRHVTVEEFEELDGEADDAAADIDAARIDRTGAEQRSAQKTIHGDSRLIPDASLSPGLK